MASNQHKTDDQIGGLVAELTQMVAEVPGEPVSAQSKRRLLLRRSAASLDGGHTDLRRLSDLRSREKAAYSRTKRLVRMLHSAIQDVETLRRDIKTLEAEVEGSRPRLRVLLWRMLGLMR